MRIVRRTTLGLVAAAAVAVFVGTSLPAAAATISPPPACANRERSESTCCTINGAYFKESAFSAVVRKEIPIAIRIPTVGRDVICTQYSGDTAIAQKHYSLVKDMGEYIAGFYKYFVGIIGILAVTMILWGAIQWITAAGNAGKIGAAKEQISAALIGLLLALASYTILFLINPNLVKLTTPALKSVGTIAQKVSPWCRDRTDIADQPGLCGQTSVIPNSGGQTCYWHRCADPEKVCTSRFTCDEDPALACLSYDKNKCEEFDQLSRASQITDEACRTHYVHSGPLSIGDPEISQCAWGKILNCPSGTRRVSCSDGGNPSPCWEDGKAEDCSTLDVRICNDDTRAVSGADAICCQDVSDPSKYKCVK